MPHVLGILGSPLPEGNTAILLARALEGAAAAGCTVETVRVTELEFSACEEIFFCRDNDTCWNKDALTPYYQKFRDLDGVILASPVMTMGIPGKLKCFMDRFQVFFMAKYIRKAPLVPKERRRRRKALTILISGMDTPHLFDGPMASVAAFYDICDISPAGQVLVPGMDRIQDIRTRSDILDDAFAKGHDLGLACTGP